MPKLGFESDENSPERRKRIQDLKGSEDPEDRIVAILLDVHVGDFSLDEPTARAKAKAVVEHFDLIV